jgi:hypothetical protein
LPIAPWLSSLLQAPTHLPNTHPVLADPGKYLADYLGLVFNDVETRHPSPERLAYIIDIIGFKVFASCYA